MKTEDETNFCSLTMTRLYHKA